MALSANSKKVFDYVKSIGDANVTAADIAEAVGLETKQVNGIVTSAFQRKHIMKRVPQVVATEDGGTKEVKFIKLEDKALWDVDPEAEAEA